MSGLPVAENRNPSARIDAVDALRGFAILCILLLHNLEHFDFIWWPENIPAWRHAVDASIWEVMDFLVAGKAYAIFALLFGFTFWLMDHKQRQQGSDFRLRFLWRMFLLLGFGLVNSLFYEGDILSMYALLGFTLVLVCRLSDRWVLGIAVLLLLQPIMWTDVAGQLLHPVKSLPPDRSWAYFDKLYPYLSGDSLWAALWGNITNGKLAVYWWSWEKGRFLQAPALFMLGMLLGRRGYFTDSVRSGHFWKYTFILASVAVLLFLLVKSFLKEWIPDENLRDLVRKIHYSWSNLSMTFALVACFMLLYRSVWFRRLVSGLIPFGRMSLTSYVMQSIIGACIYYGFGFGLFEKTDAFYCLLIGIVLFLFQAWFCRMWLKGHRQGPLEAVWHRLTWLGTH